MSITYRIYIGPYARCEVAQVPITKLRIGCPKDDCANHANELRVPFCQLCGSKVATIAHTEMGDAVDDYDVQEAINERLCSPSGDEYYRWMRANRAHLWIPNITIRIVAGHLDAHESFALFDVPRETIADEIARFRELFSDDLDYLRTAYGETTLHWGIIQDYS